MNVHLVVVWRRSTWQQSNCRTLVYAITVIQGRKGVAFLSARVARSINSARANAVWPSGLVTRPFARCFMIQRCGVKTGADVGDKLMLES